MERHKQTNERLAVVEGARRVMVMDGWRDNYGVLTFAEYAQRRESEVRLVQGESGCDIWIGIVVRLCGTVER